MTNSCVNNKKDISLMEKTKVSENFEELKTYFTSFPFSSTIKVLWIYGSVTKGRADFPGPSDYQLAAYCYDIPEEEVVAFKKIAQELDDYKSGMPIDKELFNKLKIPHEIISSENTFQYILNGSVVTLDSFIKMPLRGVCLVQPNSVIILANTF
jgi:hypothetical protein